LRYTIGYWTNLDDWVSWDFEVNEPGLFTVEVLQGCATGSGGSQVLFSVAAQTLRMVVEETGALLVAHGLAIEKQKMRWAKKACLPSLPAS
jgi:hypothetical protein